MQRQNMDNQEFSVQELQQKVEQAVSDFMIENPSLLDLEAHEQAISHRVAYYLESQFCKGRNLNVDCEYNKHLDVCKAFNFEKEYKKCDCDGCKYAREKKSDPEKLLRPDVLVHSRGNDDRNLIAIEIKQDQPCLFDEAKLKALTKPKTEEAKGEFGYQLGVFLYFPEKMPGVREQKILVVVWEQAGDGQWQSSLQECR
jgi:hypothetical protein